MMLVKVGGSLFRKTVRYVQNLLSGVDCFVGVMCKLRRDLIADKEIIGFLCRGNGKIGVVVA